MRQPFTWFNRRWVRFLSVIAVIMAAFALMWWESGKPAFEGPVWRGVTVGKSSWMQVISALGQPTEVEHIGLGEEVYLYRENGRFDWATHKITLTHGIVTQIEEVTAVYHPEEVHLMELVIRYGLPDDIAWYRQNPAERVVIYARQGILILAMLAPFQESLVDRVYYFRPGPIADVRKMFVDLIADTDPFPGSDVVGPENPWESDLKAYRSK